MEKDSGHALRELAVDGGMSNSDLCMQVHDFAHVPPASVLLHLGPSQTDYVDQLAF